MTGHRFAILAAVVALVFPAAAMAAQPHVIGQGRSSGEYSAVTVSGHDASAERLYLRAFGRALSASAGVTCSRGTSVGTMTTPTRKLVAGRLYRLRQSFRGDCYVTATLSGRGPIRLQLLAS